MNRLFLFFGICLMTWVSLNAQTKTIHGELPSFEVVSTLKPDTVVSSEEWMIRDFEFQGDDILVLTWDKNPDKCVLRKMDKDNNELAALILQEKPYSFFRDVFDHIYLITFDHVYFIGSDSLDLVPMNEDFFFGRIYPIAERCDSTLFYSTQTRKKPDFVYINSTLDTLHEIRDKHLYDLYYSEYTFLPFQTKTEIKRRCYRTGENKYEVAAELTGFTNSLWWRELYSPMFSRNDSVFIADHYKDSLYVYGKNGERLCTFPIEFHQRKGYKKEILKDDDTGMLFARYLINGKTQLLPLGSHAESDSEPLTLQFRYVNKVKVHKGKVWYLYRPFESRQNSFLYAEAIRQ